MTENNELISYAMDFVSYLLSKVNGINRIILHGSVARGDYVEDSDVDLFVDAKKNIEKEVNKALENYPKTKKFQEWKFKGIENEISIIIGNLESREWRDLKRSMMNTGIILFGKYKSEVEKVNHYVIFSFENIKPNKKRVLVYRKLFGFKQGKKEYKGLADEIKAIKIGKGALLVPIEHANELKKYLHNIKISLKLYDVWSDESF
ncbi:nucleotidyltransferase domain-containing protein [Candidatus Pacearchaeota archaeon]|nr:nucleotidyltransferase domain-containing protein [Candidatus Pacearchaeota archaeon]